MAGRSLKSIASPKRLLSPLDSATRAAVVDTLRLAPQQARILDLILQGMRDKQIAAEMGLGVPTVRTYLHRIFVRANVQDRVELILRVFAIAQELAARRSPRS